MDKIKQLEGEILNIKKELRNLKEENKKLKKDVHTLEKNAYFIKVKPPQIGIEFNTIEDAKLVKKRLYENRISWVDPIKPIETHIIIFREDEETISKLCFGMNYIVYEDHDFFLKSIEDNLKYNT